MTLIAPHIDELQKISALPTQQALPRAAAFLAELVRDPDFIATGILPSLEEERYIEDWYVAWCHEPDDGSHSLKVFHWPAGTGTKIHDHSSWGAYACAWGTVLEERYERLDDGKRFEYARLEKAWQLSWSPGDGVSTVLPGNNGIHRVGNPGDETAISVHLYGPRIGSVDGRDYDLIRDYVCDRTVD